jgi:hypothetical protein
MTVLTMPARPDHDHAPAPLPWYRMAWVTWRQHRAMLASVLSVLGATAVFLLVAGLKVHHDYRGITSCLNQYQPQGACGQRLHDFNQVDWTMGNTLLILMNLAPALLGAFTGPAVLARELETGTFRYAWTQGIGRVRWTVAKLVLLAAAVTVMAWAFSQVFAWFFGPFLPVEEMNVLAATVFTTRGIAFAAWTLAAFSTGAFLGMLLRRIVPAMAATLGVYAALAVATWTWLRQRYPVSLTTSSGAQFSGRTTRDSPWILGQWTTGATHWWRYIPVSRFWPMQLIESGWLLALSAVLIAGTVWLVRHRAA